MIVSGLLATVITYSVLRQASAQGTEVLVASRPIRAGQTADSSLFSSARVKAPAAALQGILRPGGEVAVAGRTAAVDVSRGELLSTDQFRSPAPPLPAMALVVDVDSVPGGVAALVPGSRIDVIGVSTAGAPLVVQGLAVLKTLDSPEPGLAATSTAQIEVGVPDLATAGAVRDVTSSGKFAIRVTAPAGGGAG
jgi:Flp pilus assembly protein CpaB